MTTTATAAGPAAPAGLKERLPGFLRIPHLGLVAVIAVVVVFAASRTDKFLTVTNLLNVSRQVAVVSIIAGGLTLLMTAGGMDFSMASITGVGTAVAAQLIEGGSPVWQAVLATLGLATLLGLVNGVAVTFTNVAPFVVTLATATLLDGVKLLVLGGFSISIGLSLSWLGNGAVLGVPTLVVVAAAVLIVIGIVMRHTVFGRDAFAIGGNEDVARLSGVKVARNKLVLYAVAGLLSGLAAIMLVSRLAASSPETGGLALQLEAVAAVVIGGTSLAGGRGTVVGTALGVVLLGIVGNVLNLLQISSYYHLVATGAVLLVAAVFNSLHKSGH
ncbi:ribose ABC transporter permease [Glycomyces endophyticus]|uniref:Ribose ABC transporter permease n=1 Tax=Glycomyces endophyticus TaxID=480996 RepID=A0ABN2HIB2_9ACTN